MYRYFPLYVQLGSRLNIEMGRVARYKKVKKSLVTKSSGGGGGGDYFDTVGVWGLGDSGRKAKKRSRTSIQLRAKRNKTSHHDGVQGFDEAPVDEDEFDLTDLVGSLKREPNCNPSMKSLTPASTDQILMPPLSAITKSEPTNLPPASSSTVASSKSTIDDDQEKLLRKFQKQVEPAKPVVAAESRMAHESKRAYSKRVKLETRQIIQRTNQQAHNPEKRQKKKEFLNQKKKRGGGKHSGFSDNDQDDDNNIFSDDDKVASSALLTGEQAVAARARATKVQFGEQAERPPTFAQLPRGATGKKAPTSRKAAELLKVGKGEQQEEMEVMRRKVQAQYAAIKARRKQNGDFHL